MGRAVWFPAGLRLLHVDSTDPSPASLQQENVRAGSHNDEVSHGSVVVLASPRHRPRCFHLFQVGQSVFASDVVELRRCMRALKTLKVKVYLLQFI